VSKAKFHVSGMHCPQCAMRIEGVEDTLTGVQRIEVGYRTGLMLVEFDETKVREEQIVRAVEELGYQLTAG
jgi:P-type Cu+ transporter